MNRTADREIRIIRQSCHVWNNAVAINGSKVQNLTQIFCAVSSAGLAKKHDTKLI